MAIPPFTLTRERRRTISIQFDRFGNLIVKAPHAAPMRVINRFLLEKQAWISRYHKKLLSLPVKKNGVYQNGDELLYLGNLYKLNITNTSAISLSDQINFPAAVYFRIEKELVLWYKSEAKRIITQRVAHLARQTNTSFNGLSFSDTKSKWGSCTLDNRLQFSWRLVMAPLPVIDYVLIHELIHTVHKHHQPLFWKEVERHSPLFKQHISWLRDYGPSIYAAF